MTDKSVRTTISLPASLKERMDAVGSRVNWSAVAARAFEVKLLEIAAQERTETMDDVVKRMKAAEGLEAQEDREAGKLAGKNWAEDVASPKELRRLQALVDEPQYGLEGMLDIWTNGMNKGIGWHLYATLHPRDVEEKNWREIKDFWESALGDDGADLIEDEDFAQGFVEGALEVWDAVKDKI